MANETLFSLSSTNNRYNTDTGTSEFAAGSYIGPTVVDGALRFPGVTLNKDQSISRAGLYFFDNNIFGANTIRLNIQGIKETNTSDFSGGSPMGRARTTQVTSASVSGTATSWDIDVTSIVSEIIGQSGWSSGNAMGFVLLDNSSDSECHIRDTGALDALLSIRITNPNLTPTPKSVAAPTFPASLGYGMKISQKDIDVKTATDFQLLYTSDKNYIRLISEGQISTTGGVEYLIAHGLSYIPRGQAFVRADNKSFELPRLFAGVTDPITGGKQGSFSVDSTYMRIVTTTDATVYYYLFKDEQT